MKIHIVQQGDTLWKLAKKYDVSFEQLKVVNSHLSNPDLIMPGMKIKIPTGGVPVKKQIVKKEELIQVKEQPKEAPKKEVMIPAKPEPVVVQQPIETQPIQQQPILTQQQYEQHLHNMNMNFNIYKPMPMPKPMPVAPVTPPLKVPAPPKMPDMKELPKVEMAKPMPKTMPIAKPMPKPMAPPHVPSKKEIPKVDEMPMAKQMLPTMPQCYPVTGIVPGYAYHGPLVYHPYQQGFPQYPPMSQQMVPNGYPQGPAVASAYAGYTAAPMGGYQGQPPLNQQPMMPNYPQAGYGMGQPPVPPYGMAPPPQQWAPQTNNTKNSMGMDEDLDNDYSTEIPQMVPNANMQMPPNYWGQPNFYGDVTMQQPMPLGHQAPQMQMPPQQWGYQQQPMMSHQPPASPHPVQREIEEEIED